MAAVKHHGPSMTSGIIVTDDQMLTPVSYETRRHDNQWNLDYVQNIH